MTNNSSWYLVLSYSFISHVFAAKNWGTQFSIPSIYYTQRKGWHSEGERWLYFSGKAARILLVLFKMLFKLANVKLY